MSGRQGPPPSQPSPRRTARTATRRNQAAQAPAPAAPAPSSTSPTPPLAGKSVPASLSPRRNKTGRPRLYDVGPDWREPYLQALDAHGGKQYLASASVGIGAKQVRDEMHRSEDFAVRVKEITELHADRLEQAMEDQAHATGNPVGYIVRLKALRPALYLERHLAMSITATAEIPAGDARQLLAHALGAMLDVTTQRVLPAPGEQRELDASKDASKPSLS